MDADERPPAPSTPVVETMESESEELLPGRPEKTTATPSAFDWEELDREFKEFLDKVLSGEIVLPPTKPPTSAVAVHAPGRPTVHAG